MRQLLVIEHGSNAPVTGSNSVCEHADEGPASFAARAIRAIASESLRGKAFELVYVTSPASSEERFYCRAVVASAACRAAPRKVRLTFVATQSRTESQNELFALVGVLERELAHSRFGVTLRFVEPARRELDKARAAVGPELEKRFTARGFTVAGWGDVGLVRQMSKGFAVRRPSDVRGKRPAVWRNEPMGPTVYAKIGSVVPVPVSPMEVLPALRSHKVNIVNAPALAAEQLQWTPYLDHVASRSSVCAIGGSLFRTKALEALPADMREMLDDLQSRMTKANKKRIRRMDDAAYERLTKKMKVVDLSEDDVKAWQKVLIPAVKQLSQGTLDKGLVEKVLKATGKS